MKHLWIAVVAVLLAACDKPVEYQTTATQTQALPQPAAAPRHNYVLKDGFEYGYEKALSAEDRQQGRVASSLRMFKYLGSRNGTHQVVTQSDDVRTVIESSPPYEFAKVYVFSGTRFLEKEVVRLAPDSLGAAVIADAVNTRLEQWVGQQQGINGHLWVDGDEKKLVFLPM